MAPSMVRIGLLATGNEITEGDILNTDGQVIAQALAKLGYTLGLHVVAPDDDNDIQQALRFLLQTHDVVIMTGGLGPTSDDRTRYALSAVTGQELQFDEASWEQICVRVQQRLGREPHPANRQQALFPRGAQVIPNKNGTAAGCWLQHESKTIYMLPGPPLECIPMFEETVLPHLLAQYLHSAKTKLTWQLKGAVESEIAALIDEAVQGFPVQTGYRAHSPFLEIKIYMPAGAQLDAMLAAVEKIVAPFLVKDETN